MNTLSVIRCALVAMLLSALSVAAKPAAAQCPCAGVTNSMNSVDNLFSTIDPVAGLSLIDSFKLALLPGEIPAFDAAMAAAATGDVTLLDGFNATYPGVFTPEAQAVLAVYREAMVVKGKAEQGTLDDQDMANLQNSIKALPNTPAFAPFKQAMQTELQNATTEHSLCKILCTLAALSQPPGGAGGGGGGAGAGGGPAIVIDLGGGGGGNANGGGGGGGGGGNAGGGGGYAGGGGGNGGAAGGGGGYGAAQPPANAFPANGGSTGGELILLNPEENGQAVGYAIASEALELQPGEQQAIGLPASGKREIRFDRGDGKTLKYTLRDKVYKFVVTDDGWDLKKETFKVTIDNSQLAADLSYLADGETVTVKAGGSQFHKSDFPVQIAFDRGDGTTTEHALATGTYQFGVDQDKKQLVLYSMENAATASSEPNDS